MCEEKANICGVNVTIDTIFTVKLDSQVGSTGYSWALSHMPDSVNLLDVSIETSHSHVCGCSETQVFTFVALTEDQNYLEFTLLRPWSPEDAADKRTYALIVSPKEAANDLEETAGCRKYASFSDICGASGPSMMYMSPVSQQALKYMAPVGMKYMGPPVVKYMAPVGLKYMAPAGVGVKYMGPPIIKYMAPVDCDSNNDNTEK